MVLPTSVLPAAVVSAPVVLPSVVSVVVSAPAAVVEVSGHPAFSGPVASVSLSAQQPNSDVAHAGGGGGHPSWSLP